MFDLVNILLFWVPLGAMVYHWVLYPTTLLLWSKLWPRRYRKEERAEPFFVTILMAAYNEELLIAEKLKNCLELDYPADRMEILVGSDASTDRTDELVDTYGDPRIRLVRYEPQSGKIAVQNRLLREAKGDVVLLTDVDSVLTPESLKFMLERMCDPRVAVVAPMYRRVNRDGSLAENLYDRWESKVKELEGRLGAMVGAYGWALLVRKEFCEPIPDDTVLDDFVFAVRPFRQGFDAVTEPRALVVTQVEPERLEFRRKVRINRGNVQALLRFADLLLPKHGTKAWVYFSHKVIRMLVPLILVSALVASAVSLPASFFAVALCLQLAVLATIPLLPLARGRWRKLLIPQYYYYMNVALVVGLWKYLKGDRTRWARTPRGESQVDRNAD